jgi:hypothetical protein
VFYKHFSKCYQYCLRVGRAYGTAYCNFFAQCKKRRIARAFGIDVPFLLTLTMRNLKIFLKVSSNNWAVDYHLSLSTVFSKRASFLRQIMKSKFPTLFCSTHILTAFTYHGYQHSIFEGKLRQN